MPKTIEEITDDDFKCTRCGEPLDETLVIDAGQDECFDCFSARQPK